MPGLSECKANVAASSATNTVTIDNARRRVTKSVHCRFCCTQCLCFGADTDGVVAAKLDKLIDHCSPLPKERFIVREGDPFDGVLLVRSGSVKTCQTLANGEEHITGFHFPGEIFGVDGLANSLHANSAITMETTSLCRLPLRCLTSHQPETPSIEMRFLVLLSELLKRKDDHSSMLAKNRAHEKLAAFILDLSHRFERRHLSALCLSLPMSRTDMSRYLGLSLESVSRSFALLEKDQLVKCNGRKIEIIDKLALTALAGGVQVSQRKTLSNSGKPQQFSIESPSIA